MTLSGNFYTGAYGNKSVSDRFIFSLNNGTPSVSGSLSFTGGDIDESSVNNSGGRIRPSVSLSPSL